jgi:hypothetical protein
VKGSNRPAFRRSASAKARRRAPTARFGSRRTNPKQGRGGDNGEDKRSDESEIAIVVDQKPHGHRRHPHRRKRDQQHDSGRDKIRADGEMDVHIGDKRQEGDDEDAARHPERSAEGARANGDTEKSRSRGGQHVNRTSARARCGVGPNGF